MYKEPDLFNRCIAISPAVPWDDGFINQVDNEFFASKNQPASKLFISYGENESHAFVSAVSKYQNKIEKSKYEDFNLMNFSVENMGHAGSKSIGYAQGLVWAWKDINPD